MIRKTDNSLHAVFEITKAAHYQQQLGSHGILAGSSLRSLKML